MKVITLAIFLSITAAPLIAAESDEDEKLFELRCGIGCHQLPEPSMLKAKQWQRVMVTMEKRMAQAEMAPLTQDERERLLAYLTQYARQ